MTTETRTAESATGIKRFISILSWLPSYDRSWLTVDIIAGLTLWGLVVPEAMAYAGIAGLPPQAGLYTLLAALLVYAVLGTSRHLVVQATSATAALLASAVAVGSSTSSLVCPNLRATRWRSCWGSSKSCHRLTGSLLPGRTCAGAAFPAAAPQQEDPGRPGGAVRRDRVERGA